MLNRDELVNSYLVFLHEKKVQSSNRQEKLSQSQRALDIHDAKDKQLFFSSVLEELQKFHLRYSIIILV